MANTWRNDAILSVLSRTAGGSGLLLVLTGAGVSAESGIPTFRGSDGYWQVGSRNYHPMELATRAAFERMPDDVWAWYLYRRGICSRATPNAAHHALASLEQALGSRFLLVTQNVDGLHLSAGNSLERTYQIHGNIRFMRCAAGCSDRLVPIPSAVDLDWDRGRALSAHERALLRCSECGSSSRPHVLWFDESYDEALFRFDSSIRAAHLAELLLVIGTTGSTNLPLHVGSIVAERGMPIVAVNPEPNPFSSLAQEADRGFFLQGTAGRIVPELVAELTRP